MANTEPKALKVAEFKAPEGNYRQIVKDYMMKMYNIEWSPNETFMLKWKNSGDFGVDVPYEKDKVYKGLPYGNTKASLSQFEHYVKDGVFYVNSEYYEEIVGNNCSSSMDIAYAQLQDFPYWGSLRPGHPRGTKLKLVGNLKTPTAFGDDFATIDIWDCNAINDVYEAYAKCNTGDILYRCLKTKTGHLRFVSQPAHVERFENGLIDPVNSYILTIEQTNALDKTRDDDVLTTWWIDHKYTFDRLYAREFMPVTLTIFESGEVAKDAYMMYDGENTAEDVINGVNGKVKSTFPLVYVRVTVEKENGEVVKRVEKCDFARKYEYDVNTLWKELEINSLEKGKYIFRFNAGIARGDTDFEIIPFEI